MNASIYAHFSACDANARIYAHFRACFRNARTHVHAMYSLYLVGCADAILRGEYRDHFKFYFVEDLNISHLLLGISQRSLRTSHTKCCSASSIKTGLWCNSRFIDVFGILAYYYYRSSHGEKYFLCLEV